MLCSQFSQCRSSLMLKLSLTGNSLGQLNLFQMVNLHSSNPSAIPQGGTEVYKCLPVI